MEEGRLRKKLWSGDHQEKENEEDLNLPGRKGLEDSWGGKGINGRRVEWQREIEEKDKTIVRWAQEDVETSNNPLNKINKLGSHHILHVSRIRVK